MSENNERHLLGTDETVRTEINGFPVVVEAGSAMANEDECLSMEAGNPTELEADTSSQLGEGGLPSAACGSSTRDNSFPSPLVDRGDEGSFEMDAAEKPRSFDRRDWAVVVMAIAQAALWAIVFWLPDLHVGGPLAATMCVPGLNNVDMRGDSLPGVGLSLVELVGFFCTLAAIGKRGRYDRATIPLLAACALMCLFAGLFGNGALRSLNCIVLWVVGTYTLFLVADIWPACKISAKSHLRAIGLFFSSLVKHALRPLIEAKEAIRNRIRALREDNANNNRKGRAREIGVGVVVAAALLVVVVPLLASADTVFGSLLADVWRTLFHLPDLGELPLRILYTLALAPFIFGLTWGFSRSTTIDVDTGAQKEKRSLHAATAIVILGALDVVYALFVVVQFVYLFGGAESAAMNGGYAEYARSGFFQLVAVVAINVIVSLLALCFSEPRKSIEEPGLSADDARPTQAVIVLVWALIAATFVILASAAWRMSLYVGAYGLSVLRCLTFLGMVFAAILLVTLAVKTARPRISFYRVLLYAGTALWVTFNLVNVDARIADYNVDAYLDGSIEEFDVSYFWHLSPDADPALERLAQALAAGDVPRASESDGAFFDNSLEKGIEARLRASESIREKRPWQMQCLSYWKNA